MHALPITEGEIDNFISGFEQCTLPKERWTHGAHLLTGACYVHRFGEVAAIERMRSRVSRYNESIGGKNTATSGYHESITIFWIKLLAALLEVQAPIGRSAFAALAVERYGDRRDVFREFYDFDLVASSEARLRWIEPTRKPIAPASL